MSRRTPRHAKTLFVRLMSAWTAVSFALNLVLPPAAAQAQGALNLPVPGAMVSTSPAFVPVLLKGLTLHPEDPLRLDFIVDSGHTQADAAELQGETLRLVKYFLASMTIPQDDFWVNLSPVESDRIIPDELAKTEMGRDMLAQDYLLKQLSASLLYPEEELGETFWNKIYAEAQARFGISEIPVDTFNKVWIVPEKAVVYEHGHTVYVVESRLKVMLDSDYAAWQENKDNPAFPSDQTDTPGEARDVETGRDLSLFSAQIVRDIMIPAIEQEVNEGENFAMLRQIYQSLILAKWYKETVKETLLAKVYVDQKKTVGIETDDTAFKDEIYNRYMDAYKQGVFNYIKEDYDQLSRQPIPRKYFSGGLTGNISIKKASNPGPAARVEGVGPTSLAELHVAPKVENTEAEQVEFLKKRATFFDALFSGFSRQQASIIESANFGRVTNLKDITEQLRADKKHALTIKALLEALRKQPLMTVDQKQLEKAFALFSHQLEAAKPKEGKRKEENADAVRRITEWYLAANGLVASDDPSALYKKEISIMMRYLIDRGKELQNFKGILVIPMIKEEKIVRLIRYLYDNADRLSQEQSALTPERDSSAVLVEGAYLESFAKEIDRTGNLSLIVDLFGNYAHARKISVSPDDPFLKILITKIGEIFLMPSGNEAMQTIKMLAVEFLAKFKGQYPVITDTMRELLGNQDVGIRAWALIVSAKRQDPELIETVKNLLEEDRMTDDVELALLNAYLAALGDPKARAELEGFGEGDIIETLMGALEDINAQGYSIDFDPVTRNRIGWDFIGRLDELRGMSEQDDWYKEFMTVIDDIRNGPFKKGVNVLENSSFSSSTKERLNVQIVLLQDEIKRMIYGPSAGPADPSGPSVRQEPVSDKDVGGIDFNDVPVERQGEGTPVPFAPAAVGELLNRPITGFEPVSINIRPLPSVLPLLGLDEHPEYREAEAASPLQQARL